MGDLMGAWVSEAWILQTLNVIEQNPQHTFQLLTKNPKRYLEFEFPNNVWCGTSIESQDKLYRLEIIKEVQAEVRFVSLEPLLSDIKADITGIEWVIIGGMTGPKARKPQMGWVDNIIAQANCTSVFLKDNLNHPLEKQEYPIKEV